LYLFSILVWFLKSHRYDFKMKHRTLDKIQGKTFFVGDIHGHYDEFIDALQSKNFDRKTDCVIATGDLIDKGDQSLECVRLLKESWFFSVLGNHEDMLLDEAGKGFCAAPWFKELTEDEQAEVTWLMYRNMPLSYTVATGNRKLIGVVHGHPPVFEGRVDWLHAARKSSEQLLWRRARPGSIPDVITGADAVVFGHNNVDRPTRFGSTVCIDTLSSQGITILETQEIFETIQ